MQTTSLEILKKTQLPDGQARAILRVMDLEINAHQGVLATKSGLNDAVQMMKSDLNDAVQVMRRDLNDAVQNLRTEFKNDLKDAVHALELKVVGIESRLTRWVFTCMLGQTAVIAAAVYFALTHLRQ